MTHMIVSGAETDKLNASRAAVNSGSSSIKLAGQAPPLTLYSSILLALAFLQLRLSNRGSKFKPLQ